ncbi:MAG: protein-disulfide reductase DsbD [Betaproteobacteria bacterium]|nr:protein-disulfide reductase DsbD [Betaproteobacteria bacterium]
MRFLFALACLFAALAAPVAHGEEDLLEPEKAFRLSAKLLDDRTVEARFQIAEGYYLYKNKIRFSADAGVKTGKAKMPAGKVKKDEYFGKVETYVTQARIRIPLTYPGGKPVPFTLKVSYQGCAEVGVCYQPQETSISLKPVGVKAATPAHAAAPEPAVAAPLPLQQQNPEVLSRLKNLAADLMGSSQPDFLPPDEAFKLAVTVTANGVLEGRFTVAKDYYLYRDRISFKVVKPPAVKVGALTLPKADEKNDPTFGKTYVYHQSFAVSARLTGLPAATGEIKVLAGYQGCSEKGICYPPEEKEFTVPVSAVGVAPTVATPEPQQALTSEAQPAPTAPARPAADTSETGQIQALLKGGNYWAIVAGFFGFGLLLSLTPCVFPMIPILSGIIVGQGGHITKTRGFTLSLAYVLGMSITYALAGIAAGLSGTLISNALQNPWALGAGAAMFAALALSMFGYYELQMPSFLQSRFSEASNRIRGGRFASVLLMGALSALIVGPCVAAPLAAALLYISQTGDVVLGGVSLFSLALGMGVPLLLVGLSAGALLPRAGAWMESVKKFFGVLMLGVAIWLLSPLLSAVAQMAMWAALLITSSMFLHALEPLPVNAKGLSRLWKGVGVIALVTGIAMLLGALGGGRELLQPLSVFRTGEAGAAVPPSHLVFQRVKNLAELDAAVQGAKGRYVMLDFYADWCISCKEMESDTFSDPKVRDRLKDVVLLQADVTGNTPDDKALLARFKLFGPPGILFFDKDGQEIAYRVIGYEKPAPFLASVDKAIP